MLRIDCGNTNEKELTKIREIVSSHRGGIAIELAMEFEDGPVITLEADSDFYVTDTPTLRNQLAPWLVS